MSMVDPQEEHNQKLKKFLELEQANAPPPGPMPGTNPILDAMHAQQTAIPQDVQHFMAGSAMANAQAAQNAAEARKRQQKQREMSGRQPEPW